MAESSRNKNLPLEKRFSRENSGQNPTFNDSADKSTATDESEVSKKETTYDFSFTMKPVRVLKYALQALSELNFNPMQKAEIQVGEKGCEFIAWTLNIDAGTEAFGYLSLKATGLKEFQCNKPLRKSFSVIEIPKIFKSAEENKAESVFVYVEEGSNALSFKWDIGLTPPDSIDLKDVDPACETFPDYVSYGFEAVIPSPFLKAMSKKLRKENQATPVPAKVTVKLEPATAELTTRTALASSIGEQQQESHKISLEWQYWESLESAASTAYKASVYLVTNPYDAFMLRFHLEDLGDLVYLKQATFDTAPDLPFLGYFCKLN